MTKEEAIAKLIKLQDSKDSEVAHQRADDVLLEFIDNLDIAVEFLKVKRWYS